MTSTGDMAAATPSGSVAEARSALTAAWHAERHAAKAARRAGDAPAEWYHLERAHILSQPRARLHLRTHGAMFGVSVRRRDGREVAGQLLRLLLAVPGSVSGRCPVGNTGGADVRASPPMPLPDDPRPLLLALGGAASPPPTSTTTTSRPPRTASPPAARPPSSSSAIGTPTTCASPRSSTTSATPTSGCSPTTVPSP